MQLVKNLGRSRDLNVSAIYFSYVEKENRILILERYSYGLF